MSESEYEIKLVNNTTHTWRLPRCHNGHFGMFEVRPNSELEFPLQDFSRGMYGAYRTIELNVDSDGNFEVKTKKRKGWKMIKQPDKFYIRLKNVSGALIESINLDQDRENVRLPLGVAFELEIPPYANSIIYESIEIYGDEEMKLSTSDSGYGLGPTKYQTIYHQRVKRVPRCDEEMDKVKKVRSQYYEKRLNHAFDKATDNVA